MANKIILDEEGVKITISEAARRTGMAFSTIQRWYQDEGIRTVALIEKRKLKVRGHLSEEHKHNMSMEKSRYFVTDENDNMYNTNMVAAELEISASAARDYISRVGCKTLEECRQRRDKLAAGERKKPEFAFLDTTNRMRPEATKFKRWRCFKDGVPCEHYAHCTDEQLEGRRPKRCKEDRRCWEPRVVRNVTGKSAMDPQNLVISGMVSR